MFVVFAVFPPELLLFPVFRAWPRVVAMFVFSRFVWSVPGAVFPVFPVFSWLRLGSSPALAAAERILGIVPPGTHQFTKFLTPGEVAVMASRAECEMKELAGMVYDPLRNKWSLSSDTQINFIAHCVKETPP